MCLFSFFFLKEGIFLKLDNIDCNASGWSDAFAEPWTIFFLPVFFFFVVFSLVCHIIRWRRRDFQGRVDFNLIVAAESGVEE